MSKRYSSKNRGRPALSTLYGIAVVMLIIIIILMYAHWRERKKDYAVQVKQAALTETDFEIKFRTDDDTEPEE